MTVPARDAPLRTAGGGYREPERPLRQRLAGWVPALLALAVLGACAFLVGADPRRLLEGLPRLAAWAARAWPPDFTDFPTLLLRAGETAAIATLGTALAGVLAAPLALLAARNATPFPWLQQPVRWVLDGLRGVDAFVFALLFVAAVGLGPFAGMLGVMLHTAGSMAKLWSEQLETADPGPADAASMTGAGRAAIAAWVLLPDRLPGLASAALYLWEFNLRASTVLGLVGAGGIGQELKNAVDLLLFDRVFAILLVILALVAAVDRASALLRRRLS
ncbi:MAG TPA: phosphonate ABC transporter, permease protein PhnE [Azospirillaceae bacterium]|nr:phosphonate ABC transporter, permease protein PhnE [Azospirillaceae bacterium]